MLWLMAKYANGISQPPLRPWLFRIAHNRALDLLRGRAVRTPEHARAAFDVLGSASPDVEEELMRQEAVKTAVRASSNMMWLEWREGWISFIRDYRYVRY